MSGNGCFSKNRKCIGEIHKIDGTGTYSCIFHCTSAACVEISHCKMLFCNSNVLCTPYRCFECCTGATHWHCSESNCSSPSHGVKGKCARHCIEKDHGHCVKSDCSTYFSDEKEEKDCRSSCGIHFIS